MNERIKKTSLNRWVFFLSHTKQTWTSRTRAEVLYKFKHAKRCVTVMVLVSSNPGVLKHYNCLNVVCDLAAFCHSTLLCKHLKLNLVDAREEQIAGRQCLQLRMSVWAAVDKQICFKD